MKTQLLNRPRTVVIIEALTDYLEHYYQEKGEPEDPFYLVNDHFDDFINWAYDDLIIGIEERNTLLNRDAWELREAIKLESINSFLMISTHL